MTKFETIGVERQYSAITQYYADRNFKISCDICCHKGMKLECDHCAIAVAHSLVISAMEKKEGEQ